MAKDSRDFDEMARKAAALGFRTSAEDYRKIENRLKALDAVLAQIRAIDVAAYEPASSFSPKADRSRTPRLSQ